MGRFIDALKKTGYSQEKLKSLFESGENPKIKALVQSHMDMLRTSVTQGFEEARLCRAVDAAYDAPKDQVTATLVRDIMARAKTPAEVQSAFAAYGLKDMLRLDELRNPDLKKGEPLVDIPAFTNIFVPIVMSYVKFRWGKLANERDVYPLYKYEPAVLSLDTKLKCEIITSAIQRQSAGMGYRDMERDTILPALLYSRSFTFADSSYHRQEVPYLDDKDILQKKVVKEGINWIVPHTTRTFYDRSQPLYSLNSDTGTKFCGYWHLPRYSDINGNKAYWNLDKVSYGASDAWFNYGSFTGYSELYPCQVKFPVAATGLSNERIARAYISGTNDWNCSVPQAVFFHKLNPKDHGLHDYDGMVWYRFIYAGDSTCIHAEPFAYCPANVTLYDYDSNRDINASLGLELIPHQDHISNLMTQYLAAVKSNLSNIILLDQNVFDPATIKKIQNLGQKLYQTLNILPVNKQKIGYGGPGDTRASVDKFRFDMMDTGAILNAINTAISVMERLVGFTPQEVGASATHEQSAAEVTITEGFASSRTKFTGGFIDSARNARKVALYTAMMEYGTPEILAEVAVENDADEAALKRLGFEVGDKIKGTDLREVKGKVSMLDLDSFASDRDGNQRIVEPQVAINMLQAFGVVAQNPLLVQQIGPEKLLQRFNDALEFIGVPKRWRFNAVSGEGAPMPGQVSAEEVIKIVKASTQEVEKRLADGIKQSVVEPMAQAQQVSQQAIQQLGLQLGQLGQGVGQMAQEVQAHGQAITQIMNQIQQAQQPPVSPEQYAQSMVTAPAGTPEEQAQLAAAQLAVPMIQQMAGQ